MPGKNVRGNSIEFVIKRSKILAKPYRFYVKAEDEAQGYATAVKIEAMLDAGIIPPEILEDTTRYVLLGEVVRDYLTHNTIPASDVSLLNIIYVRHGATELKSINYAWVERWIYGMKVELNVAPSTIRHHVGALARCFDWAANKNIVALALNPIRQLPKRYAQYTDKETKAALTKNPDAFKRVDVHRDRRPSRTEEARIREVMAGAKRVDRERPLELRYQAALEFLFELAIESCMRLREMYTLTPDQVSIKDRTVFLEKTKNGSKRQVPLPTTAIAAYHAYEKHVADGTRGMAGFAAKRRFLFPWWDGDMSDAALRKLTSQLSRQFTTIFDYAGADDLNFHDLRHEATSRLFEKTNMSDTQIMKITGHSSTRQLARYANLRGSDLADKLW